jgi:hypothetical protein
VLLAFVLTLLFAAPAAADRYAPPPWFVDATNELQARGATCALLDDRWRQQWFVGESCTHPLPPALWRAHGRSEACWSQAVQNLRGGPAGEESAYLCSLLANPGSPASWRCGRVSVNHDRGVRDDTAWTAHGGRQFAPRTFPTLRACLAARVLLAPAPAQGLAVTCSHECAIRVSVTRRGGQRELASVRESPPVGARRELPLRLDGPLPAAVTLHVRVASRRVTRQFRLDARWTGTALAFAPATIRLH